VTFALNASQASLQNDVGPSPAANVIVMTRNAAGVWSVTIGPLAPTWYGYGFVVGGVDIADPANRHIWSGPSSAWSFVFVPGLARTSWLIAHTARTAPGHGSGTSRT
jgi:hypothetical protein